MNIYEKVYPIEAVLVAKTALALPIHYIFNPNSTKTALYSIDVESNGEKETYFVTPDEGMQQKKLTCDVLDAALETLLRVSPDAFDTVYVSLLYWNKEHVEVAKNVYKRVMDELYNMQIADVVFGRTLPENTSISEALNFLEAQHYSLFE